MTLSNTVNTSGAFTLAEMSAWGIFFIVRTVANQVNFYLNGVPRNGTTAPDTGDFTLDRLLGTSNAGSGFVNTLGEAVIAESPSSADLNFLGRYLSIKWSLTWTDI